MHSYYLNSDLYTLERNAILSCFQLMQKVQYILITNVPLHKYVDIIILSQALKQLRHRSYR